MKSGKVYKDVKIVTKNQFGVHIFEKKNPATEKDVLRYIPFSAMNAEFLRFFPFCDGKVIDRLGDTGIGDSKTGWFPALRTIYLW